MENKTLISIQDKALLEAYINGEENKLMPYIIKFGIDKVGNKLFSAKLMKNISELEKRIEGKIKQLKLFDDGKDN